MSIKIINFAMSDNERKSMKRRELLIHIMCWGIVLFLPLVFFRPNDTWELRMSHWLRSLGGTLGYMVIFYANYLWLVPKLYFNHKRGLYVVLNVVIIALVIALSMGWWNVLGHILPDEAPSSFLRRPPRRHGGPPMWNMLFQSALMAVLVAALAMAVCMGQRWQHIEEARREAEKAKSEAELSNLRNQLNPHFLLNTLNNIYALIAFAPEKAQTAVEQLSKLLRHVLYENEQNYVPLYKEVSFMKNYIELMRIRVTSNVTVDSVITIADDDATPVAPLIFISLIENAFKHGISPNGRGFILVKMSHDNDAITCEIRNSNWPKRANDKSGSGIGLQQVQKRLDLMYPGQYSWHKGTTADNTEYYSKITIYRHDSQLRNS